MPDRPTDRSKQAIVILADGARADVFARMLAGGELPEIQRHVVSRGVHRTATSTFTSTTIPAHLPFITGRFAGSADIPGYRWFDRAKQRRSLPLGPWSFRNYNGFESRWINDDLLPEAPTIFELAPGSQTVFGTITRGIEKDGKLGGMRRNTDWFRAHFLHDYVIADESARRLLCESLKDHAPFRFVVMPGIDWNSHYDDPFGAGAREAYRRVDRTVGEAARILERTGRYEDTLIAVVSDHGHEPVIEHFDIGPEIEKQFKVKTAYHSLKGFARDPDVISAVSGNAMAHLYFNRRPSGLSDWLLDRPAVDIVAERLEGGAIGVSSRRGAATLRETGETLSYVIAGGDPFGYGPLPETIDREEALGLTADTDHPDGLLQLAQIFRSRRTGDMVVSAAPGFDLRERFERPEHRSSHGALHAAHMNVPLAISTPLEDGPVRTADVFSIVLEHLGIAEPAGVDGRSRTISAGQSDAAPALTPSA
ncbi:MAG: alkaline phosphatase family protein [Solirubrobacterales bacterium]